MTPTPPHLSTAGREPVAGRDAVWLQDSATNLMVINGVFTTDRIDLATVRRTFQERVIEADGGRRYDRFRRRITWALGTPCWEDDPTFDISRHILPLQDDSVRDTASLQRFVGREAGRPLPRDLPLWQFQMAENFENGTSAFLVRIHHSIGDGMSLVAVIFAFMEQLEAPRASRPAHIRPAGGAGTRSILNALRVPLAAPGVLLKRLLWPSDHHALHGPHMTGEKRVAWTEPLDLHVVKEAKNRLGATVNDVLMACVSGALSRYIAERTGEMVEQIKISMPVSVRRPDQPLTLENRFAAVPLSLPAGVAHVRERVLAVKQQMDALKRSVDPIVVYGIVQIMLRVLPQGVSRGLLDFLANKCTAVVTNVPGPQHGITLAGRTVHSLMFWVPQRADIGVGISILSFAGKVQVGVICDTSLVPDAADLVHAFEAEFAGLASL